MTAATLAPLTVVRTGNASSRARWGGRIISGIAVLFLTLDLTMKLVGAKAAVDGTVQLGYQPHHLFVLGVIQLVCLIV